MTGIATNALRVPKFIIRRGLRSIAGGFNHSLAQWYERASARGTARRAFSDVFNAVEANKVHGGLWISPNDQWLCGDEALFTRFVEHVRPRTSMEIGSGPFGYLAQCYWMKRRVVIDPSVDEYRSYQMKRFGKTLWTPDIETYAAPAEQTIKSLVGQVDGCIVSRNALDHMDDPIAALQAMSEYAVSGCYLLLWTDIWHFDGGDVGHRNITRSRSAFEALLNGLGFDVLKHCAPLREPREFVEYGCIAIKR
jgi:hypothetical protein